MAVSRARVWVNCVTKYLSVKRIYRKLLMLNLTGKGGRKKGGKEIGEG